MRSFLILNPSAMQSSSFHFLRTMVRCLLAFALVQGVPVLAQQKSPTQVPAPGLPETYKVGMLAKSFGDSVVIRWAPDKPDLFRAGLQAGYLLTRRSLNDDNSQTLDYQVLIKPWTVEVWLKNVSKNDTLAAACAQLVNGKNTPLKSDETLTLDKIMQQQNQADLRMTMALILADVRPLYAQGMGLGFVDRNVKQGRRYLYYLTVMADPARFDLGVATTLVLNEKSTESMEMLPVRVNSGEHTIDLSWERSSAETRFSSYFFEKSGDGGKTFSRINRIPWLQPLEVMTNPAITFSDSVAENYHAYQYRVVGITPFGEQVPSETVTGQAIDLTAPPAVTDMQARYLGKSQTRLSWKYENTPDDFAGFIIGKSSTLNGPFTPIHTQVLAPDQRAFIDTSDSAVASCYYKIVALDTARNLGTGLPIYCIVNDRRGPSQPKGLSGYIDSTGMTRIVWDVNPESNIYGYKVLSANAPDHVFIADTPDYLAIPAFNDSTPLRTLTRKKYYQVVAYDKNYNPSEPSEILALTRPDVVKPMAPNIRNYTVADSAVTISWTPSASTDVKEQLLLRRGQATERWQTIARLGTDVYAYADTAIRGESEYGYALVAVDSSGLSSDTSFPLVVKTPKSTPQTVQGLRAFVNPDKSVSLYWEYPVPNCRFTIFRAKENETFRSLDAVYDNREYRDKRPEPGSTRYAVRVMYQDGRTSRFSNSIEVTIQ
jgi:uncharacterized protein